MISLVKHVGIFSVAVATGVCAFGCGGDDDDGGGAQDASNDVAVRDGGADRDGAVMCAPADVTGFTPPAYKPARVQRGACSDPAWATQFYADCVASATSSDAACAKWQEAPRLACAQCILTSPTDATWGPLIVGNGVVSVNQAGCLEVENGAPGLDCAHKSQASLACGSAACDANCPVTDTPSFNAYQQCLTDATAGGCASFAAQANDCASALVDAGAGECLNGSFDELYPFVANLLCGPSPGDAGGG
jgi:hypothetical protein